MTQRSDDVRRGLRRLFNTTRNISMATWLAVAVLVVTITSLVVTSVLSLTYGQDLAEGLSDAQLGARASVKGEEVNRYLGSLRNQAAALSTSDGALEAMEQFSAAFAELEAVDAATIAESSDIVLDYYRDEFAPALQETIGVTVSWRSLVPVNDAGIYLQRHYIADVEDAPDLLDDAGDGSSWSEVHRELHFGIYEVALRLGAADLYLIEPSTGMVVYSASKRPDFATSLDSGPYGGTTLATVMRSVRDAPQRGVVTLIDMAAYTPDLGSPMLFMAGPVLDGDRLAGILVLKIAGEPIDAIMTSAGNWAEEGFGDTGETFLVGEDGRMRSIARPFFEDPESMLTDLEMAGTATASERDAMAGVGTTAMFLKAADSRELAAAAVSEDLTTNSTDYLLRPVLSAVDQVDLGEFSWYVMAQVTEEEVGGPIGDFRRALLIAVAIFVVGITFGTVTWARSVFRPIRSISERLRLAQDEEVIDTAEDMGNAPSDFVDLSDNIDEMLAALNGRQEDLEAASKERLNTLRSLLPPAIAERVESGDRYVIDAIPRAGIVVVVIDGLGELTRLQSVSETQEIIEDLISELDAAAIHHGLERVKLVGDAYYAGCGLSQPYLDDVPRSVAFALEVRDILSEFRSEHGTQLRMSVGVDSGPVTVGLTGSKRLVYDLWGDTVRVAHHLARRARRDEILVSEDVRRLLPPDVAVAEVPGDEAIETAFQILGHQVAEESSRA